MMLVITTQTQENYGAHDWDGVGECPQYWKFKGGQEVKVTGVELGMDLPAVVEAVRGQIEESNDHYRVTILGYTQEADSYLSWFEQSQLDYEGVIRYKEPTIDYGSLVDAQTV